MISCYILFSKTANAYHTGVAQENTEDDIRRKNEQDASQNDWKLFLLVNCASFDVAQRIAQHIQKVNTPLYMQSLRKYPHLLARLKEKYSR